MRQDSPVSNRVTKPIRVTAKDRKRSCAPSNGTAGASKTKATRRAPPAALLSEHFGPTERLVTFSFYRPAAKEVFLAGAFNDWDPTRTPMLRGAHGKWTVDLLLNTGAYEYRLIVDGVWQEDPMSARFAANPFGELNSVILVKQ